LPIKCCALLISAASLLSACGESPEEQKAREQALDGDRSVLAACTGDAIRTVSISTFSWADTEELCRTMKLALGRQPTVAELRFVSKTVWVLHASGSKDTYQQNGYQVMSIVEARGQLAPSSSAAMFSTCDTVVKVFSGTGGKVSPKDLNVMLRNAGSLAQTMSDDGIIHMAAVLWDMKKQAGE